jgi:hypothetical protein
VVQNQCLRSHSNFGVVRDILLSRDNLLSPTKGKGPFSATLSPTINRVQALGGNANTRTVPNPHFPGSTTQLGVPHPKVPDRITEQTGLHGRGRTAYPTGGFAPKIMVGVQAPQPELRSWGQRDLDDLFEHGSPPPTFFFPSFLSLKTRFGCDGEPFWKLLQRRKGYNHRCDGG